MKHRPIMTIPVRGSRHRGGGGGWRWVIGVPLALALVYVAVVAGAAIRADYPLAPHGAESDALRGAFHVHTVASDGRGTVEEIASAARAAGLRFVIVTDHNPKELAPPRYHEGVLLIFGAELSTPVGHVVALGMSGLPTQEELQRDPVGAVERLGGFSVLAHPVQQKNPWKDWEGAARASALELYSADSMFRAAQREPFTGFAPAAIAWAFDAQHGLLMLVRHDDESTQRLLSLAGARDVVALCSHDAHGIPAYEDAFRTLATYLPHEPGTRGLPGDPAEAARHVLSEIAAGRAWCGFRSIGPAAGFALTDLGVDRTAPAGSTVRVRLPASAPEEVRLQVYGPATLLEDGRSVRLDRAGAVQIEVWARVPGMIFQDGWKPWLVPSPIRVVDGGATSSDAAP